MQDSLTTLPRDQGTILLERKTVGLLLLLFVFAMLFYGYLTSLMSMSQDDFTYANIDNHGDVKTAILYGESRWSRWAAWIYLKFASLFPIELRAHQLLLSKINIFGILLLNIVFAYRLVGAFNGRALLLAFACSLSSTWIVISHFSIGGENVLISLVLMTAYFYVTFRDAKTKAVTLVLASAVVAAAYQNLLYIFASLLFIETFARNLALKNKVSTSINAYVSTFVPFVVGLLIYTVIAYVIIFVAGTASTNTLSTAPFSNVELHIRAAKYYLFDADFFALHYYSATNMKMIGYYVAGALVALSLWQQRENWAGTLFNIVIAAVFLLVCALQPLQLVSGHPDLPLRAFGFMNYIIAGFLIVMSLHVHKVRFGPWVSGIAILYLSIVVVSVMTQLERLSMDVIHTSERDKRIAANVEQYYLDNDLDFSTPVAVSYTGSAFAVSSTGEAVGAVLSPLSVPWSKLEYIEYSSMIDPSRNLTAEETQYADQWCKEDVRINSPLSIGNENGIVVVCLGP